MGDDCANNPQAMGMSRGIQSKLEGKRSEALEADCRNFISHVTGEAVEGEKFDALKDGVLLCKALNCIVPGSVPKIENASKNKFAKRANIEAFVQGLTKAGVKGTELFQVNDLYENKNLAQVALGITALGRLAQKQEGYSGPILGSKEATENKREFSQEQMDAGKHITGLQMGSNKGATQSGMGIGRPRQVNPDGK
ncbi:myophilin-like [Apostichopus japonicus]|uniref:myophilin-like n=1 Tax=Stichopus japonicus TaxID=307972 RepID=UPI003AB51364